MTYLFYTITQNKIINNIRRRLYIPICVSKDLRSRQLQKDKSCVPSKKWYCNTERKEHRKWSIWCIILLPVASLSHNLKFTFHEQEGIAIKCQKMLWVSNKCEHTFRIFYFSQRWQQVRKEKGNTMAAEIRLLIITCGMSAQLHSHPELLSRWFSTSNV